MAEKASTVWQHSLTTKFRLEERIKVEVRFHFLCHSSTTTVVSPPTRRPLPHSSLEKMLSLTSKHLLCWQGAQANFRFRVGKEFGWAQARCIYIYIYILKHKPQEGPDRSPFKNPLRKPARLADLKSQSIPRLETSVGQGVLGLGKARF